MAIELATNLTLDPSETCTQTLGALAAKGRGKSYLAGKLVEGLYDAGAPFLVLDPVGNWSSLTLAADGKSPGLSVVVIGGDRADVPLVEEHADRLGTFLILQGISAVLDVSELSKKRRKEYVANLCEALFQAAKGHRSPYMVVFEEAQVFAPERPQRGEERMLGAVTDIVRLGRNYGLGSLLVSQRPQSVSKEVLNLVECLFVGQLGGPHERKRIAEWVTSQGAGVTKDVLADLPSLATGEFCCWSPSWLRKFVRIQVLPKRTFDGSSTPKLGAVQSERSRSQREIGDVVRLLGKLAAPAVHEVPEALEAADAAEDAIRELEQRLESSEEDQANLAEQNRRLSSENRELRDAIVRLSGEVERTLEAARELLARVSADAPSASPPAPWPGDGNGLGGRLKEPPERRASRADRVTRAELGLAPAARRASSGTSGVGKPESAILGVLAQQQGAIPKARLALLAGYSPTGGAFNNCLSRLRVAAWIEGSSELVITRAGRAVAPKVAPLPTGVALLQHWENHPRMDKPMRAIFRALVATRRPLTKVQLGEKTGYSATAGAFNNAISRLRVLGLVIGKGQEALRLDETLAQAAREAA